ncbi:hypothetical protein Tco_1134838 [Tanacetum coccineum]
MAPRRKATSEPRRSGQSPRLPTSRHKLPHQSQTYYTLRVTGAQLSHDRRGCPLLLMRHLLRPEMGDVRLPRDRVVKLDFFSGNLTPGFERMWKRVSHKNESRKIEGCSLRKLSIFEKICRWGNADPIYSSVVASKPKTIAGGLLEMATELWIGRIPMPSFALSAGLQATSGTTAPSGRTRIREMVTCCLDYAVEFAGRQTRNNVLVDGPLLNVLRRSFVSFWERNLNFFMETESRYINAGDSINTLPSRCHQGQKYLLQGCNLFLAHITIKGDMGTSEGKEASARCIRSYLVLAPVARAPYRLAPSEMKRIGGEINYKSYSDKGFISPSSSTWGDRNKQEHEEHSLKVNIGVLFRKEGSCMQSFPNVNFGFQKIQFLGHCD